MSGVARGDDPTETVTCPLCGAEDIINTGLPKHLASDECEAHQSDQTAVSDYSQTEDKL